MMMIWRPSWTCRIQLEDGKGLPLCTAVGIASTTRKFATCIVWTTERQMRLVQSLVYTSLKYVAAKEYTTSQTICLVQRTILKYGAAKLTLSATEQNHPHSSKHHHHRIICGQPYHPHCRQHYHHHNFHHQYDPHPITSSSPSSSSSSQNIVQPTSLLLP